MKQIEFVAHRLMKRLLDMFIVVEEHDDPPIGMYL